MPVNFIFSEISSLRLGDKIPLVRTKESRIARSAALQHCESYYNDLEKKSTKQS